MEEGWRVILFIREGNFRESGFGREEMSVEVGLVEVELFEGFFCGYVGYFYVFV